MPLCQLSGPPDRCPVRKVYSRLFLHEPLHYYSTRPFGISKNTRFKGNGRWSSQFTSRHVHNFTITIRATDQLAVLR
uniref:Uncharacterized protein n=1 Tax=Caenorhabditis japonica TaxID=281687 RepID=A0A8R1IQZ2_CAEJA